MFCGAGSGFGVQILVVKGLHGREYIVAMLGSIRNSRTFPFTFHTRVLEGVNPVRTRFPLLKTTALREKLTFGDPFEDSSVVLVPPSSTIDGFCSVLHFRSMRMDAFRTRATCSGSQRFYLT